LGSFLGSAPRLQASTNLFFSARQSTPAGGLQFGSIEK
jgi:hypothetical protein